MNLTNLNQICMNCFSERSPGGVFCPLCGYSEAAQGESLYHLPPRSVLNGKYLIGRVLGEGGFGITYIGYDLNLDLKVAVKEYYPSGLVMRSTTVSMTVQPAGGEQGEFFVKGREWFVDEAKRLARFRTLPGIVMVNDFFVENGTAYIVMEFVEGVTLKSYLAQVGGRLPAAQVLEMLASVFGSLAEVHQSGIIHRDISPDNIMITPDGRMKLLDFGAAREFGVDERSLSVMLKHGYAPMEQYTTKGRQGPHTDVYALSATIYKAITGQTPESAMDRSMEDTLPPPSFLGVALPPHQETALMRGMALRVENRWRTVGELYNALGIGVQTPPAPHPVGTTAPGRPSQHAPPPPAPYAPHPPVTMASAPQYGRPRTVAPTNIPPASPMPYTPHAPRPTPHAPPYMPRTPPYTPHAPHYKKPASKRTGIPAAIVGGLLFIALVIGFVSLLGGGESGDGTGQGGISGTQQTPSVGGDNDATPGATPAPAGTGSLSGRYELVSIEMYGEDLTAMYDLAGLEIGDYSYIEFTSDGAFVWVILAAEGPDEHIVSGTYALNGDTLTVIADVADPFDAHISGDRITMSTDAYTMVYQKR